MSARQDVKDLVILTADGNAEHGVRALVGRGQALGTRAISADFLVHPERDPGCLRRCHEFLRPQLDRYRHALVVFDREGCGDERAATELEAEVETRLRSNGWEERAAVVVVDPEFDAWVWSPSPHVDAALGWTGRSPPLREWLETEGLVARGEMKPDRPKEAMERALEIARRPRSSARYSEIGSKVSLVGCTDRAFVKFSTTMKTWFAHDGRVDHEADLR